jgi:hypothetical protein
MGRNTGNKAVVAALQSALQAFLDDQRKFAATDEEWVTETASYSKEQMDAMPGCDCNECQLAGQLLGRI